jgi:hypothetical protein
MSPELVAGMDHYLTGSGQAQAKPWNFVVENYQSVIDAIGNATCRTAVAAAASALEPIRQLDRDYDARTNHGETEGVRFP